jgi:cruciform cutting endonuclease 1
MALKIPPSLKLVQLKNFAVQCGISSSGTKGVLTARLIDEIKSVAPMESKSKTRLLSIDMGIRNLAYCIIDVPSKKESRPSVIAWKRIAVSAKPTVDAQASDTAPKETFEPSVFAEHAYNLLRKRLLLYEPTHILIERQRFRSMGSPRILEWTVRVNMFESMLYAVAQTLSAEQLWKGTVTPIPPGKVGPFWIGTEALATDETSLQKTRTSKSAKQQNKGAKIDLVQRWLSNGDVVELGTDEVKRTGDAYMKKWHRLPGGRAKSQESSLSRAEGEEEMGKLDDLADSLLQGMAWMQWEENKRKFLKHGVEALEPL